MRKRYVEFLTTPKRRRKLLAQLPHFKHWNPLYCVQILPSHQHPNEILELLTMKGAGPTCWVISEDSDLDAREMGLRDALKETIGQGMGTILSCVPGKLAYFEDEEDRYILQRK
jgi:hypothetical protein